MRVIQKLLNKIKVVKNYLMSTISYLITIINQAIATVKTYIIAINERATIYIRKKITYFWSILYTIQHKVFRLKKYYSTPIMLVLLSALMITSVYLFNIYFQNTITSLLSTPEAILNVQFLFLTLGGALISASVIVFTLVVFAMQANIERMPYGLFRKLSDDKKILVSFIATIILAASIASISLIQKNEYIALAMSFSVWVIIFILILFVYAFKRALVLVNPIEQLNILIKDVDKEMVILIKRFKRLSPLLENNSSASETTSREDAHDMARITFFKLNPSWTGKAEQGIKYAMSFAIRYAEQGDHEVSNAALKSILSINHSYINAKGKTFFNHNWLIDNPYSTDGFINDTLEHLRQAVKIAVHKGDEQFIEQLFETMQELCYLYLNIDYCSSPATKSHALLASGYLSEAVKSVVPHNMPDVLMEGTRLISKTAKGILLYDEPMQIKPSVDDIGLLASLGSVQSTYRPVTSIAMRELASLDLQLMSEQRYDIKHTAEDIRRSVNSAAKLFLNIEEAPMEQIHSSYLGPYYSATDPNSLVNKLIAATNQISEKDSEDSEAITIIDNIEQWVDGRYSADKELLLLALEKRSSLIFDIINWIKSISEILLALSNADACDTRTKEKLREHALWIVYVFDWIPKDEETTRLVERYSLKETLFEIAMDSEYRGDDKITEAMQKLLLTRGFSAGKYETGISLFENTIYALATLALRASSLDTSGLKDQITYILGQEDSPNQEMREKVAKKIKNTIVSFQYDNHHHYSKIMYEMHKTDAEEMQQLLNELAHLLDPNIDNV